ncbi:MAG: toxin-antitoxin system YwqK family antitoxin [Dysgonamonadaceae bacterium]|jgi:antitoxin component YwqK of YwqJK toxin-antitoxin module|nr:toxin-antitoxin system YwqK family antitoxin [Dysgonamonadaceae bacterium]
MKIKFLLASILACIFSCSVLAQSDFSVGEITVINLGDGRLLFRSAKNDKPLKGEHRIIDGRNSEYISAQFLDGLYDGKYERYRYNNLVEKGTYKAGVRSGIFIEYYSDNSVKSETPFTDGKLNGILKTYFTNGKLESQKEYKSGVEDGVEQRWHWETGKQTVDANYVDGKPDGKQIRHITSNTGDYVEVSNYKKGVQTGEFSQTWTNGQERIQGKFKDGKKDGVWIEYRKSGKPEKSTTYKNGERNGEYKVFFTDGTVEKIENYVDGQREGISQEFFFDSGKLKAEYNYANNVKEGKYKMYYDDGTLREEGRCEDNREIYRKEYYKNGKVKEISERNSRGQWETLESYNSDGTQR